VRAPWGALSPQLARDVLAYLGVGAGHVVLEMGATDYTAAGGAINIYIYVYVYIDIDRYI